MNDFRRTLLWGVLALSLVMLWDGWLRHTGQPSMFAPPAPVMAASSASVADAGASSVPAAPTTLAADPATVPGTTSAAPASTPVPARELIQLSTDVLKVAIDPAGGSLVKVELLKHVDQDDATRHVVVLDQHGGHTYVAQSGLIPSAGGKALPTHLTPMTVLSEARELAEGSVALEVKLQSEAVDGVRLLKTYTFKRGSYAIDVRQEVVNESGAAVNPTVYMQLVRDNNAPPATGPSFLGAPQAYIGTAVYSGQGKFQKVPFEDIEEGKAEFQKNDNSGWVSMIQHYFASAWLHNEAGPREFFARKVGTNLYAVGMMLPVGEVAGGQSKSIESVLFVGPQEENNLAALAPDLDLVKDYGWFTVLAKPLFWLLDKLHGLIGNWGWAIVALVVLLKAAFYWLNAKAYASMAKMKKLNPRIQAMRESLKDKPQQMQQVMMKIYSDEKVNPLGGCLPILIQIPVFIALYWVLVSSVEIRNAPWIGWIHDLSVKDPYFVLPALMTASTLLQTWLNPTPPDPMQAKLMWIMPMMFSVMFFFFPAGLVLYWLTNNLLSIAQQWTINRRIEAQG